MKTKNLLAALFLIVFQFAVVAPALAEDLIEPLLMPGTVEGTGTYFEVTDSDYLNVTLYSSAPVTLTLESVPNMVVMDFAETEGGGAAQLTLGGFAPSTTYYKYEDNYHNKEAFTTDANGSYSWLQDLSAPRQVWVQPNPSTKFIIDDATGGDCTSIGLWDAPTKTCTLTMNVLETIQIDSDDVTLDGDGHLVQGTGSGFGVNLRYRTGATIKNLVVQNFTYGIYSFYSSSNTLTGNTFSNNGAYGIFSYNNSSNTLTGNTFSNNGSVGIYLYKSSSNTLSGNTVSNNGAYGIYSYKSSSNTLSGNTVSNNGSNGIYSYKSSSNTLTGNTFSNNGSNGIYSYYGSSNTLSGNTVSNNGAYGIYLYGSNDNQIYNNNFIDNGTQARIGGTTTGNSFSLPAPIGGNYWNNWTGPDSDEDGFVDSPYVFIGGQDDLPWAMPNGWLNKAPVADAGGNIQVDSVLLASTLISGTATDPDDDSLLYRWLLGETVLLDWTPVGEEGEAPLDLALLPYLETGNFILTMEVTDDKLTTTDSMELTIDNSPPEVMASPSYQVVELALVPITVVADVTDFDGDLLSYEWLLSGETLATGTVQAILGGETVVIPALDLLPGDSRFPLGTHIVELKVDDQINAPVSGYVTVVIKDTLAPSLSPQPSRTMLWPPNHTLRPVTIMANASDHSGGAIILDVTVGSSELPDMDGDGNTIPDFYIDSINDQTGEIQLSLRSERSGKGDGRTYTVSITATDESGNSSVAYLEIRAPHDKRKK